MMSALTLTFPACFYGIYVMIWIRPKALTLYLAQAALRFLSARRIFTALPVILLFPFFGSAFALSRWFKQQPRLTMQTVSAVQQLPDTGYRRDSRAVCAGGDQSTSRWMTPPSAP